MIQQFSINTQLSSVHQWPGRSGFNPRSSHTKDLKNGTWYLLASHSAHRYVSRVKWSNPGEGVASSPRPWCSSYWKGSLRGALDYSRQLNLSSIWPIHRTLLGSTTPGQSEPGRDNNERVLRKPKAPALLELHHQIISCHNQDTRGEWGGYFYEEMQSVYSTSPADWTRFGFMAYQSL